MVYENPENYEDSEQEKNRKQRKWCLKKALKLAELTEEDLESEEVVIAAENFNDFIKK